MNAQWHYFTTNYREAWNKYRKSEEYTSLMESLKLHGIRQPYRSNIVKQAFAAGWNASGIGNEIIKRTL